MKLKQYIKIGASTLCLVAITACSSIKMAIPTHEVFLQEYSGPVLSTYTDIDYPIKVRVNYETMQTEDPNIVINGKYLAKLFGKYTYTPDIPVFAKSAAENYMDAMGFKLSPSADYVLDIDIKTFDMVQDGMKSKGYNVILSYSLHNEAGESLGPIGSSNSYVKLGNSVSLGEGLGQAYYEALKKINWQRIAKLLTVRKSPKQEKNKKVRGEGDTALEHTVIRWNIVSRPQGADVSWRVISSTPDVQNTNSNYVGNTPYESTESFDIKGLTYNNSGNVQIEVTCERSGYLPQKKRFNLRQAIDQKEISAMFNLVKDE